MSISVQCRQCGQRYKVSPAATVRKITCQKCQALIEVVSSNELMPPSVGASSSSIIPPPRPVAQPAPRTASRPPDLLPPKPVAPAPVAQPIGMVEESPPHAQMVEIPVIQVAPVQVAQAAPTFEPVRSSTVEEMLDEQDRADRDHFRRLRRGFRNPPNMQEMLSIIASHKLLTTISVIALFFVLDYLRSGHLLFALVFGSVALGLVLAGSQPSLAMNAMYQAGAWCYLVVLCAFPVALRYQNELGLAGSKVLQNPKNVAVARPATAARVDTPPPPTSALPNSELAVPEEPADESAPQPEAGKAAPHAAANTNVAPKEPAPKQRPNPPEQGVVPAAAPDFSAPAVSEPLRASDFDLLLRNSEKAFGNADPTTALKFLYADALSHSDSEVWRFIRWSKPLNRPLIAIRWGAVLESDDLAAQVLGVPIGRHAANQGANPLENQKTLGTAFIQQTMNMGGPAVVSWFRSCNDEGRFGDPEIIRAPTVRDLRGATYLGADTPAEVLRAARAQQLDFLFLFSLHGNAGARPTVSTIIRVVDVLTGRELHVTKPKAIFASIRKEAEATLELLNKEMILEDVPETIDPAAVQSRLKALAKKTDNPLGPLTELLYYHREKRLPEEKVAEIMTGLIGADDAQSMLTGSDSDRRQIIAKWIPKAP